MNKIILRLLPVATFMLSVLALSAQTNPTCPSGPGGGNGSAPIDGGVSALLIGAGVLGYKHLRKNKGGE